MAGRGQTALNRLGEPPDRGSERVIMEQAVTTMSDAKVQTPRRRRLQIPHVYVIILGIIALAAILTHFIPAGAFDRVEIAGRDTVIEGTYHPVDAHPATPWTALTAIYNGMIGASGIVFYIFIIGASFGVLRATGAIDAGVSAIAQKLRGREILFIPVFMTLFSLGGAMLGLAEESIMYIAILVPIAVALGYDSIVGAAVVLLGGSAGFTAAFMNPFTVGIAQGLAGLPIFSGIGLRITLWAVLLTLSTTFVMLYARRIKKDPARSVLWGADTLAEEIRTQSVGVAPVFTTRHKAVLLVLAATLVTLAVGVTAFGWFLPELSALFILMGILVGVIARLGANGTAEAFISGAREMVMGALVVGLAYGILVVFQDGRILDTLLVGLASAISALPGTVAAVGMFFVQGLISFLVPSGSGQAALTMPILAPLADMVGATRQTAVLAYQLADGIGNMVFPTAGFFMASLAVARISWSKWVKWVWPLLLAQTIVAVVVIAIAHMIGYK